MKSPAYIWIGNPEHRRWPGFQRAAREAAVVARLLSYEEILACLGQPGELRHRLAAAIDGLDHPVLRLEAPGKNVTVSDALTRLGGRLLEEAGAPLASGTAPAGPGRLGSPRARYTGYAWLLRRLDCLWSEILGERDAALPVYVNHPEDVLTMCSKPQTYERFFRNALPVPRKLTSVNSYEELLTEMGRAGISRVFLKPAHGSSGVGIVALRVSNLPRPRRMAAYSTAVLRDGEVYNSRRIRRYESPAEIARIIDRLAGEELHVEEWIPKPAPISGYAGDWRLLVIAGRARHRVLRLSRSPFTNLHLGNERSHAAADPETLATFEALARQTAACFPRSLYFGLDVIVRRDGRPIILEANAYGDLLPGVLHQSQTTYAAELAAFPDFAAVSREART